MCDHLAPENYSNLQRVFLRNDQDDEAWDFEVTFLLSCPPWEQGWVDVPRAPKSLVKLHVVVGTGLLKGLQTPGGCGQPRFWPSK